MPKSKSTPNCCGGNGEVSPAEMESYERRRLIIGLCILIPVGGMFVLLLLGVWQIRLVVSGSMEPSLQIGDRILLINSTPIVGEAVAFQDPASEDMLIKRVVAADGDTVDVKNSVLYVNGQIQNSDTVTTNNINWKNLHVDVPIGHVFVLGDNRNESYDSLNFGTIPVEDVKGVLYFIVWPPGRWGPVTKAEFN